MRTRALLTPQSRSGCYTCKKRKVRCDEDRPACLRCLKAGRTCEGYLMERDNVPLQQPELSPVNPCINLPFLQSTGFVNADNMSDNDFRERWLRAIGSTDLDRPGSSAFQQVLRSSSGYLPSAVPALQALEALRDSYLQRETAGTLSLMAHIDQLYGLATHMLSNELSDAQFSSDTVFISSMLLLATELLRRRRQNGLTHSIGALQSRLLPSSSGYDDHSITHLCRIRDLQCLLYSQGVRLPRMTAVKEVSVDGCATVDILDVERRCIEVLHYTHSFIARVHYDTVLSGRLSHESTASGYIRPLETARRVLDAILAAGGDAPSMSTFLVLRNLLTMTIVELKQLYASRESQWDCFLEEFSSILTHVNTLQTLPKVHRTQSRPFTLLLGVIPPLQMVALKCRHFSVRVQAIAQLAQAKQEGPFIGPQLAAMAATCMEMEGQPPYRSSSTTAMSSCHSSKGTPHYLGELPVEDLRVSSCTLLERNGRIGEASQPKSCRGRTMIRLLRRKKAYHLIQARVLTSTSFRVAPEFRHLQDQRLDPSIWESWTETIDFGLPALIILARNVTKTNINDIEGSNI